MSAPLDDDELRDGGLTRRRFIESSALVPVVLVVGACGGGGRGVPDDERPIAGPSTTQAGTTGDGTSGSASTLRATPSCQDGHEEATPDQTEGPFYTPQAPRRSSLVTAGMPGTPLLLTGDVVDSSCRPVRGALLDFWQADAAGRYDNDGFTLRGHQFADARGRFGLRTIVPGLYPGRTRHIHVKVQRPHGDVLTTQLYFPGEPRNRSDSIFDDALVMDVLRAGSTRRARFRFVLG
jgi:protocatechuate 3,4-dioxygenase beta subunit